MTSFSETVAEAVREFAERGFTSEDQLRDWMMKLKAAAEASFTPRPEMERMLRDALDKRCDEFFTDKRA